MSDYTQIQSWYWEVHFFEVWRRLEKNQEWTYAAISNKMRFKPVFSFLTKQDAIDHWTKLAKSQSWSWVTAK